MQYHLAVPILVPANLSVRELVELERELIVAVDSAMSEFTETNYNSDLIEEFEGWARGLYRRLIHFP